MQFTHKREKSTLILYPVGDLDMIVEENMGTFIEEEGIKESLNLLFNMESVRYVGSSGLTFLIFILKKLKEKRLKVVLCQVPLHVLKVMEVANLSNLFEIFDTEQEALNQI